MGDKSESKAESESSNKDSITSEELMELHNNITTNNNQQDQSANPTIINDKPITQQPEQPESRPQWQCRQTKIMNIADTNQQTYNVNNATIKEYK